MKANHRKHNDTSQNSSTYHKKDGTNIRAILKEETRRECKQEEIDGYAESSVYGDGANQ